MHPLNDVRVAVTGATGHVGANLVPALLAAGARVRALVRDPARAPAGVEPVQGDVLDPDSLARAFDGAEVVFHLAARISIFGDPGGKVSATNIGGARNAARAARAAGARRMVHVSSVHAFVASPEVPLTEAAPRPTAKHAAYDRSKAGGEAAVREEAGDALEVVIANPTGIMGPNDFGPSRSGKLLLQLYHRTIPALPPGGFDWVDVRDVADALVRMAHHGRHGENYLIGGKWWSAVDLAALASRVTGKPAPRWVVPMWLAYATAPIVANAQTLLGQEPIYTTEALDAVHHGSRDVRTDKARAALDYVARPLEDTLRDTYAFFRAQGMLRD